MFMIEGRALAIGLGAGMLLITLGLVPGLSRDLGNGVVAFLSAWTEGPSASPLKLQVHDQPLWLSVLGTALVLISILAYL